MQAIRAVRVRQHAVATPLGGVIGLLFGPHKIDHNVEVFNQIAELIVVLVPVVHLDRRLC